MIPLIGCGGSMVVLRRRLTVVDRTIIEWRRRDGLSIRMIAQELGHSSGTVRDEIRLHGETAVYRAATAEADAAAQLPPRWPHAPPGARWAAVR